MSKHRKLKGQRQLRVQRVVSRRLAREIAEALFQNCRSISADRLVMEMSGEHFKGAGWCKQAVVDVIHAHLSAANAGDEPPAGRTPNKL